MNIAIDARYMYAQVDGITRHTLNLLRGIAVVAPERRIIVLASHSTPLPEDIQRAGCFDIVPFHRGSMRPQEQLLLPVTVRRLGIKLLHSPHCFTPLLAPCRKVVTVHDLIPIVCRKMLPRSRQARWWFLWKLWLKGQVASAAAVITVSRHSASDLQAILGTPSGKIRVIPNGILPPILNTPDTGRMVAADGPLLLYVGRRQPYKNLVGLVRTLAELLGNVPRAHLVIAGSPDARYEEAEEEVRRLKLDAHVTFAGHVSDAELAQLYRQAAVFVFPSYYEGFGLPPLEAMAYGVPVVSSNRASLPEVLGDAAFFADPDSPGEMANAVRQVLSRPEIAERLRRLGRERSASFTIERQARETLQVYDELIRRP